MNSNRTRKEKEEILRRLEQQNQIERHRQNQQRFSPTNVANKLNGISKGMYNTGSRMQKLGNYLQTRSNPTLNRMGSKLGSYGSKMQNMSLRPQFNAFKGNLMNGRTVSGTPMSGIKSPYTSASSLGTAGTTAANTAGATGTGIGSSIGGAGALGTSGIGTGVGTSSVGASNMGSSALGSSLLSSTGGGSAAGMGQAGATSALGGSTAAATSAGSAGAGAGAGAAGAGGAAAGAGGAAAGASMAVPVIGWAIAAAAAAKMIKDKIDEAHKKVNARAMQADEAAINASMAQQNKNKNEAMGSLNQDTEDATRSMAPDSQMLEGIMTGGAAPVQNEEVEQSQSNEALTNDIMNQVRNEQNGFGDFMNSTGIGNTDEDVSESGLRSNVVKDSILQSVKSGLGSTNVASTDSANIPVTSRIEQNYDYMTPQKDVEANSMQPLPDIRVKEGENGEALIDEENSTMPTISQDQDTKQSIMDRIRSGLTNFKTGYDDNSLHGFSEGDMHNNITGANKPTVLEDGTITGGAAQTKKTLMNRIGEAMGTGRRLMANPWVQAGIAGGISKAAGGDIDDIALAAYKYGTAKQKADEYYRQMHPDAKVMPVFNTFGAEDYKAKAYNDFNQGRSMISRRDLFKLNNPNMSDEEVNRMLQQTGINGDEMISLKGYDSVQKANYNTGRLNQGQQKIDNQKEYQQGQLQVSKGRAVETARHNRVSERQRGQSIANTKANSDRNYNLKVKQHQQKIQKEVASGNMVRIKAPNGEIKYIPKDKVNAALAAGGTRL